MFAFLPTWEADIARLYLETNIHKMLNKTPNSTINAGHVGMHLSFQLCRMYEQDHSPCKPME
jgi:hypothetical protein